MMRVRACTMRCRCHSSCRRSRFSQLGTQICGKSSFSMSFRISCASLAIRLLLAYSLGSDLSRVSDPQLEVQLRQQSFKPARLPTGFHPQPHLYSLCREIAVELLRFLAVLQSPLSQFSGVGVHKSNLLEGRVVIASYNHHVRLLSPEPFGWFAPPKLTRHGSRHCYGINFTHCPYLRHFHRCFQTCTSACI